MMREKHVAMQFVDAINAHDVEAIVTMITDDHRFVDTAGQVFEGREGMREAWSGYFKMVPDYTIEVAETLVADDTVVLLGSARGIYSVDSALRPENRWTTPAAWRAVVTDEKIAYWQVYADNEPLRNIIRRENTPVSNGRSPAVSPPDAPQGDPAPGP